MENAKNKIQKEENIKEIDPMQPLTLAEAVEGIQIETKKAKEYYENDETRNKLLDRIKTYQFGILVDKLVLEMINDMEKEYHDPKALKKINQRRKQIERELAHIQSVLKKAEKELFPLQKWLDGMCAHTIRQIQKGYAWAVVHNPDVDLTGRFLMALVILNTKYQNYRLQGGKKCNNLVDYIKCRLTASQKDYDSWKNVFPEDVFERLCSFVGVTQPPDDTSNRWEETSPKFSTNFCKIINYTIIKNIEKIYNLC